MNATESGSEQQQSAPSRRRWLRPAPVIIILLVVIAIGIGNAFRDYDGGVPNMVTMAAGATGTLAMFTWFVMFAPLSRRTRGKLLVGGLAAAAVLIACFRLEGFSGDMRPRFAWRWTASNSSELVAAPAAETASVAIGSVSALDYPRFLGPGGRAEVHGVNLAKDWNTRPPKKLWRQPIGEGWSAFAVVGNHAVTQEQRGEQEMVTCYELKTGKLLWAHSEKVRFSELLGGVGPRATPTIQDGKVYALGATGILNCLDGATGQVIWRKDILADNGAPNTYWGKSGSPLVTGELVVVSAGGSDGKSLVAYRKDTGERVWSGGWELSSYSSPVEATLGGLRQILIVNESHVAGHDAATGELLWEHPWEGRSDNNATASQPVVLEGDRVFLSKGYGVGATVLRVSRSADGKWQTEDRWGRPKRVMKTKFANVVIRDGHVYGLDDGILQCIELETGKQRWKKGRYQHGQIMLVGDVLLVQAETGEVALVEPSPERYRELTKFQAIEGKCWNNPAFAGGKYLLVRNNQEAACYELPLASDES